MFEENYIIKGKIKCLTGLHIGGLSDTVEIGGSDNVVIRDAKSGMPYIPGSSLKGKLRSLFELYDKESSQDVLDNGGDPSKNNTPAVQIFGNAPDQSNDGFKMQFPTRIIVRDSFPDEDTEEFWRSRGDVIVKGAELKYENVINRINSSATPRNIERVPKDSVFEFEIIFSVYEGDEKENFLNVFIAMALLEDNYLGGSGSRGSGQVKFEDIEVVRRTRDYYLFEKPDGEDPLAKGDLFTVYEEVRTKL